MQGQKQKRECPNFSFEPEPYLCGLCDLCGETSSDKEVSSVNPSQSTSVVDGPKDQPYARGQVVRDAHGGRFIVLRVEGKDPAGHWVYRVARDFTRPLDPSAYRAGGLDPSRLERAELNYAVNKPLIRLSAGDAPQSDVAYLVASGPSLRRNAGHLLDVRRGVVVGVNQTPRALPTARMDYFFCLDGLLDGAHWKHGMPRTVGVFDAAATPAVHLGKWRETRWFVPAMRSPLYDRVRADFPHLVMLEHGLNVTFTALSWIVRVLRARTIVLVGMDSAFTDAMKHFDEPLAFDAREDYVVAKDVRGRPVVTNGTLLEFAEWHAAAFWFLRDAGIRVINATEGGILTDFVEIRGLADVVDELNAAPARELQPAT